MTEMEYRQLGDSGLTVSVVGLGCNNFGGRIDADQAESVVTAALDAGITLFDTADVYGDRGASEEILGKALRGRRDEAVVATKFGGDMKGANGPDWGVRGSRRYIRKAVEASLRRLGTDWIDLYQLHVPDLVTPIEETLAALSELVAEGKVRYLGSSQFAGWQVVDADWAARTAGSEHFISAQNRYNLLEREAEDGTRLANMPERLARADFDKIEALDTFAAERDLSLLDVAIGGLAAQPTVASVIAGATRPEQIEQNVRAGLWEPTLEDLAALDELT